MMQLNSEIYDCFLRENYTIEFLTENYKNRIFDRDSQDRFSAELQESDF